MITQEMMTAETGQRQREARATALRQQAREAAEGHGSRMEARLPRLPRLPRWLRPAAAH